MIGERSHRAPSGRGRLFVTMGLVIVLAAAAMLVLTAVFRTDPAASGPGSDPSSPVATGPSGPASGTAGPGAETVAPAAPTGLRVTGRSVSGVSLDWAAATDNVGVTGYVVLRDGARVGTTAGPGATDMGLSADTAYVYTVAAFDAAGNTSAPSASVTATTLKDPDLARPTAPTGLAVNNVTESRITLMWSPARDNIGVAGYRVFRDGRMVANVHRPGFTDTGLTPRTAYRYKVLAFDMSDNVSAYSGAVTATTRARPTSAPPHTSSPPAEAPRIESVRVTSWLSGCTVAVEATVVASAPMTANLAYTVDGKTGAEPLVFTAVSLTHIVALGTFVDNDGGMARARVENLFDAATWPACDG